MAEERKKKSVQVNRNSWEKLKAISTIEEVSINTIIENLVDRYVSKMKYKIPKDDLS